MADENKAQADALKAAEARNLAAARDAAAAQTQAQRAGGEPAPTPLANPRQGDRLPGLTPEQEAATRAAPPRARNPNRPQPPPAPASVTVDPQQVAIAMASVNKAVLQHASSQLPTEGLDEAVPGGHYVLSDGTHVNAFGHPVEVDPHGDPVLDDQGRAVVLKS